MYLDCFKYIHPKVNILSFLEKKYFLMFLLFVITLFHLYLSYSIIFTHISIYLYLSSSLFDIQSFFLSKKSKYFDSVDPPKHHPNIDHPIMHFLYIDSLQTSSYISLIHSFTLPFIHSTTSDCLTNPIITHRWTSPYMDHPYMDHPTTFITITHPFIHYSIHSFKLSKHLHIYHSPIHSFISLVRSSLTSSCLSNRFIISSFHSFHSFHSYSLVHSHLASSCLSSLTSQSLHMSTLL